MKKYSIYLRVSTQRQYDSHLGIEAQTKTCKDYIASVNGEVDKIFVDAKSGKSRDRKGLWDAINYCKETGQTLVFAKLDRLARDVEFTFKVKNTGIDLYFCDMPVCNSMILSVFAGVAEYERSLISSRTKAALKAKKERGCTLGRPKGCEISPNAINASRKARRNTAKENPHNLAFKRFMNVWESEHGQITRFADISDFVAKLNALNFKTARGLPFDENRARAMAYKIKNWELQK